MAGAAHGGIALRGLALPTALPAGASPASPGEKAGARSLKPADALPRRRVGTLGKAAAEPRLKAMPLGCGECIIEPCRLAHRDESSWMRSASNPSSARPVTFCCSIAAVCTATEVEREAYRERSVCASGRPQEAGPGYGHSGRRGSVS